MDNQKIEIGRRIRNIRRGLDMTQEQFAESLDISTNFVSEIENGKKSISQDTLCRLCETYHLSADYLLFGKKPSDSSVSPLSLSDYLSSLSAEDIPVVIEYLEARQGLNRLERKRALRGKCRNS